MPGARLNHLWFPAGARPRHGGLPGEPEFPPFGGDGRATA